MKSLLNILKNEPDYARLLKSVQKSELPMAASGLSDVHKSLVVSALNTHAQKKIFVIVADEPTAVTMQGDLMALGTNALILHSRDYNLTRMTGYSKEYEHKRIDTLSRVLDGAFDVVLIPIDAAVQYTVPTEILKKSIINVSVAETVDMAQLCETLVASGYTRSELCEGVGQFAARGGIVDVFATGSDAPVRIEFWGDEIDSMSYFDISTQRRTENIQSLKIFPANELVYDAKKLAQELKLYADTTKKLTDTQKECILKDIDLMQSGLSVSGDLYLPFLYEKVGTIFDYIKDGLIAICETGNIFERLKSIFALEKEDITALLERGELCPKSAKLRMNSVEFLSKIQNALYLENFPRSSYEIPLKELFSFNFKRSTAWSGDINTLCEDISYTLHIKGTAIILAGEQKAAKVLSAELCDRGINALYIENPDELSLGGVYVLVGGLSSGFEIPAVKLCVITHKHILGERKRIYKKQKGAQINSLEELHRGDYVVHASHGIGIFDGINRITNSGVTKDYIKIKYAGTDVLYVPVTQLDLVSKYIGAAQDSGIKLNKLGGNEWQRTRARVKKAVKDMAKQLTALYAKRMSTKGYSFREDDDLQSGFESRFEYEETEDQLRSINEIKKDMERPVPMDRLLCGDVGFGKTEVALRAAFKCVSEGKQCALLVPTTILAMQHYNTVIRRFGELPLTVKLLNRFVSKREQEKTIAGLKSGRVDMVVGTHRLISKDVEFKNIGLVIIDEEQRFGVAQKERLKELYPFVDILTLSATPIPRTLNMAMSGLRDMSTIDEAPSDRHPVQTYVLEQNDGVLVDAINKELRRGGQVYYLHNRVDSITRCATKLKEKLPNARIGIAHGKMSEDELSDIWKKLLDHEIDVLVCTTIIETGVDVPNANTLIIEDADRMGLSQLHQLRGRVGRSPRRAYAYFCFKHNREISETATKRLEAIRQFTEFGSGFKIAMRDLEIRGAGSILGGEQHGNMEAVGYDMYLKLLADAVNEEKGIESHEDLVCTIDLNISAHIPESYIAALPARLGIYRRIADIRNDGDVADVIDELCDRFGELPKAVLGLINVAILRSKASNAGITEITSTQNAAVLRTVKIDMSVAAKLSDEFGPSFSVAAIGEPAYIIRLNNGLKLQDAVARLSKIL
ncbi:MAG: transcription-repair coupling factor [Ruminococcaceae bacterium]|nr:transcription-repair coupling factor [Oscillospiraceae bacterium]